MHMKPSFVEIMKEQEIKVKDIHQQSIDKLVNIVSTLNKKLEQCLSITEQIDNKEKDDCKRRQNVVVFNLPESFATLQKEQFKKTACKKKSYHYKDET